MADAPSGAEERASYAALKDALLAVNKENTYNVLSELKKPWSHKTLPLCSKRATTGGSC